MAAALSMDSMVVSMCGSLDIKKVRPGNLLRIAVVFGLIQALFFFIGWVFGASIVGFLDKVAGFISFALLVYLGISMIVAAFSSKAAGTVNLKGFRNLFLAAIATSIDAAGAGVSVAMTELSLGKIIITVFTIFIVTLAASAMGTYLGKSVGKMFGRNVRIAGGVVLIFIAIKLLFHW